MKCIEAFDININETLICQFYHNVNLICLVHSFGKKYSTELKKNNIPRKLQIQYEEILHLISYNLFRPYCLEHLTKFLMFLSGQVTNYISVGFLKASTLSLWAQYFKTGYFSLKLGHFFMTL